MFSLCDYTNISSKSRVLCVLFLNVHLIFTVDETLCRTSGSLRNDSLSMYVIRVSQSQRATVCCYSMSSGLTGCGSGMIDFFSVSLDRAFLMSAGERQQVLYFS